jgi:hypothetical protein
MNAIRIRKKIDSETIHIPELRPMIGRDVEIIVLEDRPSSLDEIDPQAFWKAKSVDELAKEQGVGVYSFNDPNRVVFTEEDFEGFDEQLEEWRKE